jgi:hypothetical protein
MTTVHAVTPIDRGTVERLGERFADLFKTQEAGQNLGRVS